MSPVGSVQSEQSAPHVGPPPGGESASIEEAITILRRAKRGELPHAVEMLEHAGTPGIERLLKEVAEEAAKRRPHQTRRWAFWAFAIAIAGFVALQGLLTLLPWDVGPLSTFIMNFAVVSIVAAMAASQFQVGAAEALAHLNDIRAVGPLAEVLGTVTGKRKKLVLGALERMLPRLELEQAALLDEHQRIRLARAMARADSPGFTIAAIGELDRIGDTTCADTVRRIACGQTPISHHETVRLAAADAMPRFERRAAAARQRATLVRPAEAPGTEALLRPYEGAGEMQTGLLVRPADGPGPGDGPA